MIGRDQNVYRVAMQEIASTQSTGLTVITYSLRFFHEGASERLSGHPPCAGATAPGTGRLALQALLGQARLPTWRLWARDAAIEKKDVLKARDYA